MSGHPVSLQRVRPARQGAARGLILGLPAIRGDQTDITPLIRNSLHKYEVWSANIALNGARIDNSEVWLGLATEVAQAIQESRLKRPAAFVGFSIGGYLGWIIDRVLVRAGWSPTPVINLDGGALHLHRRTWHGAVEKLLTGPPSANEARMLLLHCAHPAPLRLAASSLDDWVSLGVPVQSLPMRTVHHADLKRPSAIAAASAALGAFVATGAAPVNAAIGFDIDTSGSRIFRALVAPEPPRAADVRKLLAEGLSVNANVLSALLFLGAATGDADLALEVSRQALRTVPGFRQATYAAQAVLREAGGAGKEAPPRWGTLRGAAIGSEESLNFAAGFCRRR